MDTCGINIGKDCENLIMDYVSQLEHVDKMKNIFEKINCYGKLQRYYEKRGDKRIFSNHPLVSAIYVGYFISISIMGNYYINIKKINDKDYNEEYNTCRFIITDMIDEILDEIDGLGIVF